MEDATVDSEAIDEAIWIPDLQTPESGVEVPEQEVQKTSVQVELEPYEKPKRLRKQPERYGFSNMCVSSTVPAEEISLSEALEGPEKEQWRRAMTDELQAFEDNDAWEKVQEHNSKNLKFKMGLNAFSDWTPQELKYLTGTRVSEELPKEALPFPHTSEEINEIIDQLSQNFDLRIEGAVNQVKRNERRYGSPDHNPAAQESPPPSPKSVERGVFGSPNTPVT
ncbi:unnamed protein product [Arctia plantaginis]|uniref:Cathepsin propeptide inhibitor domain-containing protein n=1 Tax=Arctia plantaginis TaxID=874455 RepID=A0A8S0ZHL8_ARCPL|nr:unnamed protein product [Arctia plantaginis]